MSYVVKPASARLIACARFGFVMNTATLRCSPSHIDFLANLPGPRTSTAPRNRVSRAGDVDASCPSAPTAVTKQAGSSEQQHAWRQYSVGQRTSRSEDDAGHARQHRRRPNAVERCFIHCCAPRPRMLHRQPRTCWRADGSLLQSSPPGPPPHRKFERWTRYAKRYAHR